MNKLDQELQIAFEKYEASQYPDITYEQLKSHFDDNELFLEERYPATSRRAEDFEVYKAAWQEQQKKIDVLQKLDDAVRQIIKNKKEVLSGFKNPNEWDECTEIQYSIAELETALQGDTNA